VSSAILYVAIVAIWIGVLVPRWLRHDNSHTGPVGLRRFSRHFGGTRHSGAPESRAGFDPGGHPRHTSFVPAEPEAHASSSHSELGIDHEGQASLPPAQVPSYGWSAGDVARQERLTGNSLNPGTTHATGRAQAPEPPADGYGPQAPHGTERDRHEGSLPPAPYYRDDEEDAERRARMVRGRRRMLWLLLVLSAVGIGLAYLQFAAWWIMIPPVVLLCGYLLLLREAAQADAEAREQAGPAAPARRADETGRGAQPTPATAAPAAPAAHETGPHADIIDISDKVSDQLYDQYADAKLRAVGD
jgi:hypothetical protein